MTERDALTAAVVAAPDDDLPRLVFADWLTENGAESYAEFIRAQIAIAAVEPWEPIAVAAQRHRFEADIRGTTARDSLPPLNERWFEWFGVPFRRGFGHAVVVRQLSALLTAGEELFAAAPVGHLHLPTAGFDEWKQFAQMPWLPRVRRLQFYGLRTAIEPLRALCERPDAPGIEEISLERASSPGLPILMSGLFRSPFGQRLTGLQLKVGYESREEMIDALGAADRPGLRRLSLITMGLSAEMTQRLAGTAVFAGLTGFEMRGGYAKNGGVRAIATGFAAPGPTDLRLVEVGVSAGGIVALARSDRLRRLKRLELTGNRAGVTGVAALARSRPLAGLRSLALANNQLGDDAIDHLVRAHFWPGLVELDLSGNRIGDVGAATLMRAELPKELTAIVLTSNPFGSAAVGRLMNHFGERLIL